MYNKVSKFHFNPLISNREKNSPKKIHFSMRLGSLILSRRSAQNCALGSRRDGGRYLSRGQHDTRVGAKFVDNYI